ncbi:hypothetical protein AB751O23_DF_00020 [Chlamydiales bacterium SCGC AB-751-O23]|nr:hypothetical protein AB751O23_DF_00020 [Chlamydiales bacterium SCGC AB-751-O23]
MLGIKIEDSRLSSKLFPLYLYINNLRKLFSLALILSIMRF